MRKLGETNKTAEMDILRSDLRPILEKIDLATPKDRESNFEPKIVQKGQRGFSGLDDKILTLYAKGQTTKDIADTLKEMYGVEVSHTLISQVTESIG